jgi:hypothetical protein
MNNPPAGAWVSQIEGARTTSDLVRMLREYVTSLNTEERAQLPQAFGAEAVTSAADIQEWAVTLAREDLRGTGPGATSGVLHQAAVIFAAAGARLPKVAE